MLYLKMDVLQLADVFENFVQTSTEEYGINPMHSYSAPGYTWKAGLKLTNKVRLYKRYSQAGLRQRIIITFRKQYPWRNFKCYG